MEKGLAGGRANPKVTAIATAPVEGNLFRLWRRLNLCNEQTGADDENAQKLEGHLAIHAVVMTSM